LYEKIAGWLYEFACVKFSFAKIFRVSGRTIRRKANSSGKEKEKQQIKKNIGLKEKVVSNVQKNFTIFY